MGTRLVSEDWKRYGFSTHAMVEVKSMMVPPLPSCNPGLLQFMHILDTQNKASFEKFKCFMS